MFLVDFEADADATREVISERLRIGNGFALVFGPSMLDNMVRCRFLQGQAVPGAT